MSEAQVELEQDTTATDEIEPITEPEQPAEPTIEQIIDEHIAAAQANREAKRRQMEYIKFGILAVILFGAVVIIALAQPVIFGQAVPAIMGGNMPAEGDTGVGAPMPTAPEEGSTAVPEMDVVNEEVPAGEVPAADAPATDAAAADAAVTDAVPTETFPTAVPTQTYTVQVGDTLTSIAQRYGVTVDAIIQANGLTNPDSVLVGTVLIIPLPAP
jgi:LysM repeat protein